MPVPPPPPPHPHPTPHTHTHTHKPLALAVKYANFMGLRLGKNSIFHSFMHMEFGDASELGLRSCTKTPLQQFTGWAKVVFHAFSSLTIIVCAVLRCAVPMMRTRSRTEKDQVPSGSATTPGQYGSVQSSGYPGSKQLAYLMVIPF